MRALALLPLGLLVVLAVLVPVPAASQYLFLDTNKDGIHDANDRLGPGTTFVDIWLVTNQNRDGTPVSCVVADSGNGLTINSYSVVLHATGGDVQWGPMQNRLPFSTPSPACFAMYEDTTDTAWYHNGWGWSDQFPPGKHLLATLPIHVVSGDPSIFIEPYLPRHVVQITAFGTSCMGYDGDNTYKLGSEFQDADGLGPLRAEAGGPYQVQAGRTLTVDGTGSRSMVGSPLTYAWNFGDGATAATGVAMHVYAAPGDYPLTLAVDDGSETDTDTTNVHVVAPQAPFARIVAPSVAYVGVDATFDGSLSYDPDGDLLQYEWDFGDQSALGGIKVQHHYSATGVYTVTLTVRDGLLSDTATRQVTVNAVPHPPKAMAGGPYAGLMGRLISFDGTRSSDPDGDPLVYMWSFGDRSTGSGPAPGHVYDAPGLYTVSLTVSDGGLTASTTTSATVKESLPARVFANGSALYTPGQSEPMILHLESADRSYGIEDIQTWPISMRTDGTGTMDEIACVADAAITPDSDGNRAPELTFQFSPEELALLFAHTAVGTTVTAHIRGDFARGGHFTAELPIRVDNAEAAGPLRISPNPFNPEAVVTFSTTKPGPVRAQLFNVHGRLVRTILYEPMTSGRHVVTLDARNDAGGVLASGIYFFRLTGPDGVSTKRVAIAK